MSTTSKPPRAHILHAPIIGVGELAEFLGVEKSTVHVWGTRNERPPADYIINNGPAWRRLTVIKWAAKNGKISAERAPWLLEEARPWIPEGGYQRRRRPKAEIEAARLEAERREAEIEAGHRDLEQVGV